jgi:hypothetical protein
MSAARHLLNVANVTRTCLRVVALRTPLRLGAFALLALVATWPLLANATSLNAFRDAHVLGHYESTAALSLVRFHQMPLWDPYYCGGMYLLGTPQARFVSPTFFLTLLFGETRGEALTAFAMTIVGLEGTFRYARSQGAGSFGSLLAAPLFALSGIFALAPALGWVNFFSFELLPWVAFGARTAFLGRRKGVVIAAGSLGWCIGFGGTYTAPLALIWCAFEALDTLTTRPRALRPPGWLGQAAVQARLIAVLALSLAAVRLWPIAQTLSEGRRIIGGTPGNSWPRVIGMLLRGMKDKSENGSFFVGALAIPATLLGLARPRAWRLGVVAVLSIWLAAGYAVRPSLFAGLRELPVYSTLRYPERFLILATLAISVLAAEGVTIIERLAASAEDLRALRIPDRVAPWLGPLLGATLVTAIGPLVYQHVRQASRRELIAPPLASDAPRPFHQARGNRWALAFYEPMDRGSLSCWDAYAIPESPLLRGDLEKEERLTDEGAGSVVERSWSPNQIDLDVALARPARLEINQNFNEGWRVDYGEIRSDDGLLAVDLPAGEHALSLRFEPRSARGGAIVSMVACLSLGVLVWYGRRRRNERAWPASDTITLAGVAAAPCLAFVLCAAGLQRATPIPPTVPKALDGQAVVVDSLPEATIRVDAKLAEGLTFEGASLSNPRPSPNEAILLELDWRRSQASARGLGVFVHIEASKGDPLNGDHVLISSILDFDDAPADKTLRDVVPVSIPDDAAGKTFKVWVGIWHMRGNGRRVPVVDPGPATIKDQAILAATFVVNNRAE